MEAGAVETSSDSNTSYQTAWSQLLAPPTADEGGSATCSPDRMRQSASTGPFPIRLGCSDGCTGYCLRAVGRFLLGVRVVAVMGELLFEFISGSWQVH